MRRHTPPGRKELPTEAEWEYAARVGLDGAVFAWGDEMLVNGRPLANFWQGDFPWRNEGANGWRGTSPVGSFPPNGYWLYDATGNVWEWTTDYYSPQGAGVDPSPRGAPAVCPAIRVSTRPRTVLTSAIGARTFAGE
jgi:formylglycine-generating enzyme